MESSSSGGRKSSGGCNRGQCGCGSGERRRGGIRWVDPDSGRLLDGDYDIFGFIMSVDVALGDHGDGEGERGKEGGDEEEVFDKRHFDQLLCVDWRACSTGLERGGM